MRRSHVRSRGDLASLGTTLLAALMLLVCACGGGPTAPDLDGDDDGGSGGGGATGEFRCTQVIGFSQTGQWFSGSPDFEQAVGSERWQLVAQSGAGVGLWADPNYSGWTQPPRSPCSELSDRPDRVLLTISGSVHGGTLQQWTQPIQRAIDTIRQKLPSAQQIMLQPVVGGPGHAICRFGDREIRASANHPVIDQAIQTLVGGDVVAGASPEVRTCSDYFDQLGHLTDDGAADVGRRLGEFYASR